MNTSLPRKLRYVFLSLLATCTLCVVQAQSNEWFDVGDGVAADVLEDVTASPDGNVYVTGRFMGDITFGDTTLFSNGGNDVYIAKFDSTGNLLWAKGEGHTSEEFGVEIGIDSLQNVYVAGRFIDTTVFSGNGFKAKGLADIFVVKYDTDGNYQWMKVFGGNKDDRCRGLDADAAGNVYLGGRYRNALKFTGSFTLYGQGADDAYVAKLNTNGDFQWARSIGSKKADFGEAIKVDPFGNVISTGSFFDTLLVLQYAGLDSIYADTALIASGGEEGWIAKWDPNGNLLWAQLAGGTERDYGEDISTDEMGNIFLSGAFSGTGWFGGNSVESLGGLDFFIAKYDPDGRGIWARAGGSPTNNDVIWGSDYDGKGNLFITGWYRGNLNFGGYFIPSNESYNWFAAKLDANGKPIWVRKIGHQISFDLGRGIAVDQAGDAYTVGSFQDTVYFLEDTIITDTLVAIGASDALVVKLAGGAERCAFADAVFTPGPCDPLEDAYDLEVTVTYLYQPDSGELWINGYTFPITSSPQTVTLENIPADDSLVDVLIRFTEQVSCNFAIMDAYKAPAPCGVCTIVDVSIDSVSPCKPSTNTYFVQVTADYAQEPDSGLLVFNDREFNPHSNPLSVTLFDFYADGNPVDLAAYFSEDTTCRYDLDSAWISPPACASCQIVGAVIDTITGCNALDNTYSASILIGYVAVHPDAMLEVNGQLFEPTGNPMSVTLNGLPSDGAPVDLLIRTTTDTTCLLSIDSAWNAPAACDTCHIATVALDSMTGCDPFTQTFDAWVSVTYSNPPDSGMLDVNGIQVPLSGSPQIVALSDLNADGGAISVSVFFTEDSACAFNDTALFTAPAACDTCIILSVSADSIGTCDPASETYSAYLSANFLYAPDSGNLVINGVEVPVDSTTSLSLVLDSLPANGSAVAINAFFSESPSCAYVDPALFVAPDPCDTCARTAGLLAEFDSLYPGKALLSWDAVPEALSYLVQGRRVSGSVPATVPASTNAKLVGGIKANKTYVWWVFALCADDTSAMSVVDTFTAPSMRLASTTRAEALEAFPNPADAWFALNYEATQDATLDIRINDLAGRLIRQEREQAFAGSNMFRYAIGDLEQGIYLLELNDGLDRYVLRLAVSR